MRHSDEQVAQWRSDGAVLLPAFLAEQEVAPARADFAALYGTQAKRGDAHARHTGGIGGFSLQQFENIEDFPFNASPATNLIGLHPALIALARAALGTDDVRMYQCHSWAKFTGDADYDQPFHCDYKNHTLTVPSDHVAERTINFMIYLTEVTDDLGAIHYVPHPASDPVTGKDRIWFLEERPDLQAALKASECSGAGPAGSVFAYGIDVYHRGTNLTRPGGHRYTITASYKAAGNDMIGWSAWPYHFLKPWGQIFDHASPEQLACLGVPPPGDGFWTERTLRRAQERWPGWDMAEYRAAVA